MLPCRFRRTRRKAVRASREFVPVADLAASEALSGAAYELTFTFDRAVMVATWAGAARPSTAIGGFTSTTKASFKGGHDDDDDQTTVPAGAETACGT